MQTITVCTDAGHKNFHKQSVAVWAAYIRTPSETIYSSGIINQHVNGSSNAEQYAVANALHIINKRFDLSKYRVLLYSDNTYAIANHIDETLINPKTERRELYDKFVRPIISKAAKFEARHVKAHLPKTKWGETPARFYMQYWCDKEVHRVMAVACQLVRDIYHYDKKTLVLLANGEHN